MENRSISLGEVASYYSAKISEYGETPQGVDWNGAAGQNLRFAQLIRIIDPNCHFSLIDIGCGYGALLDFLNMNFNNFSYLGLDISKEMISSASSRAQGNERAGFRTGELQGESADYVIASGIFNVRLKQSDLSWRQHIGNTLEAMNRASVKGFAFNCLTSYSDSEKMRDYLFYADCLDLFDLCKRKFSKNVALLHDYDLYEFTILVKKVL